MNRWILRFSYFMILIAAYLNGDVALQSTSINKSIWDTGYVTEITVTNFSQAPISSWQVNFSLQQGQKINCLWNGTYAQNNQSITITNQTENGRLAAGESIILGFQATNPGGTTPSLQGLTARGNADVSPSSGFSLDATSKIDTVWATAYQVTVTLTNRTNTPTASWIATFAMPAGHSLSNYVSGGQFTVSGQNVTVANQSGAGSIQAGGSTSFNMIINMPLSGMPVINQLQAFANGSSPPPVIPIAPSLNAIAPPSAQNYIVSWNSVPNAALYTLQQDTSSNFSNPTIAAQGNILSKTFTNQPSGTYFYRVSAMNSLGTSPYSNSQSVTVSSQLPIPTGIEQGAWYIDWTSWFNGPPFNIPAGINTLNIFVGQLTFGSDGKPTLDGFGNLNSSQLSAFAKYCHAQASPIAVKVSIGGSGGMYDRCWDLLTPANVQAFAQGLVDFCHTHELDGVDFDYEEYASSSQEILVGTLIKSFKAIDPRLQTSLCTNAGFGTNFPWQQIVKTILDAALFGPGNCAVDRLYIMSYYNSVQEEQNWIIGWANWLKQNYGFTTARVSVGIDDFDAHAYDPIAFKTWALNMGFSTVHWAYDPARP